MPVEVVLIPHQLLLRVVPNASSVVEYDFGEIVELQLVERLEFLGIDATCFEHLVAFLEVDLPPLRVELDELRNRHVHHVAGDQVEGMDERRTVVSHHIVLRGGQAEKRV